MRPLQQRAGAEHHHLLAGRQHRPADVLDDRRRRAFDRKVGMVGQFVEFHQRTGDALRLEPGLRLGAVARRRAGERQSRHAVMEPARQHASDRAEAGNGNAGLCHGSPLQTGHTRRRNRRQPHRRDDLAALTGDRQSTQVSTPSKEDQDD